jgi:hypothetical protein
MEIASGVYVIEARDDLAKYVTDETTCEGATPASLDEMVKVAFHRFKNEAKLSGIWKQKKVVEGNDIRMKRNSTERLERRKEEKEGSDGCMRMDEGGARTWSSLSF